MASFGVFLQCDSVRAVFLVCDFFQPFGPGLVAGRDRDVLRTDFRSSAMPMLDARRTLYDVAFADELFRLTLFLEVPAATVNIRICPPGSLC